MKVNLSEYIKNRDNIIEWFVINAITQTTHVGKDDFKVFQEQDADGNVDICLTMNGKELSFIETLENLQKHVDALVEKRAKELFGELVADKMDKVNEAFDGAVERLDSIASLDHPKS